MKKIVVVFLVLVIVLSTTITKNSTKKLDKEIYNKKENIRLLKNSYEMVFLEHSYLTSPERLFKFQEKYFNKKLIKKDILKFGKIIIDKKSMKFKSIEGHEQ